MSREQESKETKKTRKGWCPSDDTMIVALTWVVIAIAFYFLLSVFLSSCDTINSKLGFTPDHPLEELTEKVIERKTGLDIDLSTQSPEVK